MALVQLGNDFQVGGQHPEFGGGAQLQLAAFIDVERLVCAVGLHPYHAAVTGALEQGEAVAHIGSLFRGQQTLAKQADLPGKLRVGQLLQVVAGGLLQLVVQRAGGAQVEAIQVIQRHVEHG